MKSKLKYTEFRIIVTKNDKIETVPITTRAIEATRAYLEDRYNNEFWEEWDENSTVSQDFPDAVGNEAILMESIIEYYNLFMRDEK